MSEGISPCGATTPRVERGYPIATAADALPAGRYATTAIYPW
ncbi:hypothetical protein DDI_1525 [Dickeya dianthicola RNS04.9]|nr:hypothetical protein DDI_1525 [Dickeya dianthicola RNS04.9]